MAIITVGGNTIVKSITVGTPIKQVTGSFKLDNLPDVDIGSVADGDLLIYDSAKAKYTKVTVQTSNGVQKAFDDAAQTYTLSLDSGASVKLATLKIDSLTSDSATIAIGSNLSIGGNIAVTSGYTVSADSATFTRIRTANYALPINDAAQTGQALVSDGAGNVTFAFAGVEGGGITVTRTEQLSDVQNNLDLNKNPGTYLRWDSAFTTYDSDGQFTARIFNEDVRSALSAAGDITYDSATGRFSLNVETVYTAANFDSDFNISMDAAGLGGIGLNYNAGTNTLSIDSAQLYAYYNVDSASQATNALTADSATVSTTSLNTTGNAATATQLATARAIGGVNFDGTAAINLPGVNTAGNQNTSGNAATADSATISTLSLNTSGNAATATILATARTIGGVSFNGSAPIDLPGVNTAGNQNTSGNAATADSATVATNALNTTGNAATADSATTATTSLLAGRASILATARAIGGVSFDGSAPIDLPGVNAAGNQNTSGNAATATKLATARAIGGVNFDGTGSIDLPGVNAAGNQNTSGNAATADSATVATNALNTTGNAATATQLATARTIGGVSFNGTTSINLPGVNTAGNQATSGNAATATQLATPRTIAGVNFDGTAPISLALTNLGISDGDSNQVLQADGDGTFSFVTLASQLSAAQVDSLAKSALIGLDAGGDGSFAYDSATGRFTYTGPNATEVRAHFTAGNNITIADGKVSIDSNSSVIFSNVDADSGHIGNISSTNVLTHNLTVTGTQTVVDTTNLEVADPLIRLATGNDAADILDLGIIGKYYGGANREHTGIFRDASNSEWYLFDGLIDSQLDSAGGVNLVNRSGTGFVLSTLNAGTFVGALSGNATTATTLATTRTIGGVNFDGSAAINLPGVNAAGNQNTSGTAAIATAVTVSANDTENATMYPVFVDGATGTQGVETDTGLTYNPNSGILTATAFAGDGANLTGVTSYVQANFDSDFGQKTTANLSENTNLYYTDARVTSHVDSAYVNLRFAPVDGTSGMYLKTDGSGNHTFDSGSVASAVLADTATILATARTIGGVSFNGSAAINLPGVNIAGNQATSGNAATATKLATARAIGGVNFDGSAPINLPGVNTAGNQNTSGTAAIATTVTMAATDTSTDAHFPLFSSAATGNEEPRTDTGLTYVPTSGTLTALVFAGALSGNAATADSAAVATNALNTTGNAATATQLATARAIGGVNFDGTGSIDLPGVNTAGNQNTSGTAAIATTVTIADESTDTTCFPLFVTAATGDLAPKSGTNLTFNSSNGTLGATVLAGAGTGITGLASGNFATAVTLVIKNSAGTALKTIIGAAS
jgi:hypothetical protein